MNTTHIKWSHESYFIGLNQGYTTCMQPLIKMYAAVHMYLEMQVMQPYINKNSLSSVWGYSAAWQSNKCVEAGQTQFVEAEQKWYKKMKLSWTDWQLYS